MVAPPIPRGEFAEKNRLLLQGDAMPEGDLLAWTRGRDWLAERVTEQESGPARRRSPRLRLVLNAHIAGVGGAVTDDLGFRGMSLRPLRAPSLHRGEEASVRVSLLGRSIYLLGKVVWLGEDRLGIALDAAHPADERALQAAVCNGHLDRWQET
jgi:hypothetical protein